VLAAGCWAGRDGAGWLAARQRAPWDSPSRSSLISSQTRSAGVPGRCRLLGGRGSGRAPSRPGAAVPRPSFPLLAARDRDGGSARAPRARRRGQAAAERRRNRSLHPLALAGALPALGHLLSNSLLFLPPILPLHLLLLSLLSSALPLPKFRGLHLVHSHYP